MLGALGGARLSLLCPVGLKARLLEWSRVRRLEGQIQNGQGTVSWIVSADLLWGPMAGLLGPGRGHSYAVMTYYS